MSEKSRRAEEFLYGFAIPFFVIIGDFMLHLFGFLFYLFPLLLAVGTITSILLRKWWSIVGIIAFIIFAFISRGFFPVFWSWIMADNKLVSKFL